MIIIINPFGNPAIRTKRTRSFAPPHHYEFAFIGDAFTQHYRYLRQIVNNSNDKQ